MAKSEVEIIESLPGEAQVDPALLDVAVETLNRIYVAKGLETAREMGEYVLGTFFGGDLEAFHSRGKKHASMRALAAREDLHPSHTVIWRSVAVIEQLRLLPENVASALPYTHHTLLLPVRDEKAKVKLAQRAVEKGLTKRALAAEVKKVREKEIGESKAGRPPLPAFIKTVNRLEKLTGANELWEDLDAIDRLDVPEAERLWKAVTGMKLKCEELQRLLQPKMPGGSRDEGE